MSFKGTDKNEKKIEKKLKRGIYFFISISISLKSAYRRNPKTREAYKRNTQLRKRRTHIKKF
jgi:hypothetical protein